MEQVMKVVEINSGFHGSTGTIMLSIADKVRSMGNEAYTFSELKSKIAPTGHYFFGSKIENILHRGISVLSGISGKGSKYGTKELIKQLDTIHPDILHLHNLHGWYINIPMLFEYIKKNNIKTVWTLHDCWGFTAQCSHFTMEKCEKWKTGCYDCPRYKIYPYTLVDRTKKMWHLKKTWFSNVENMVIVTPSEWLSKLVKQSFLSDYPVRVINNGIDLDVFKPTNSDFRKEYGIEDKKIVLGVASDWNERKGLDVFFYLAETLPREYKIVLVGTNAEIDKSLPEKILSIHRTQNQEELAKIYTAADVFVNPTREENFPTVNIEALACGTPIVTFKTGGSPEILDASTGRVVAYNDILGLKNEIIRVCTEEKLEQLSCIERSKLFSADSKYGEYIALYNDLIRRSVNR